MKRLALFALCALAWLGCEPPPLKEPPPPPPVDDCANLPAITADLNPRRVRVSGSADVVARGGSGRYLYAFDTNASGAMLSGVRYQAGTLAGKDIVTVSDDCSNVFKLPIEVLASFDVVPATARVKPTTEFTLSVVGMAGAPRFLAPSGGLASGGSVTADGLYTAGTAEALDLIEVQDSLTGEQVIAKYEVANNAQLQGLPPKLSLPAGASVPLKTLDGSGVVTWSLEGPGALVNGAYVAIDLDGGDAHLTATDRFTKETATIDVRVLTELTRPNTPQGRRTDTATMATADFDGDGFVDLAVGVPESDLAKPQGGAVFIYRGGADGLSATPAWQILGDSDTGQLGAVLAAGDLDGDGKADLAISEPGADITVSDSGAVLLYRFGANGPVLMRPALTGLGRGNFGSAMVITDIDGDGDLDLIVGSPGGDLAPTAAISNRGVVDVFLLQKNQPFPDLGAVRVGGADLNADGGTRAFGGLRSARGLVVADLNDDGAMDLASLTTVNNSLLGGTPLARNQIAVQLHFGRKTSNLFQAQPDGYVLPINPADTAEGTWRLGVVPKAGGLPPLLVLAADQTDAPNLADAGGATGGTNAGGALLFDLTAQQPTGAPSATPFQLGRADAWARVYGDASSIAAGRSFASMDLDGDGKLELVLGAPYATASVSVAGGAPTNLPNAGKLLVFPLSALSAGAVVNKPATFRAGTSRADTLGTAVAEWRLTPTQRVVVAHAGRASTSLGAFTGRVDAFTGAGDFATWSVTSSEVLNKPASQQLGAAVDLVAHGGVVSALVGSPGTSGPASDNSGNDVGAGMALLWSAATPAAPRVVVEGAGGTAYVRDSGWPAFGGRTMGADVTVTDFDGDNLKDLVIAAPNFTLPTRTADGGAANASAYASPRLECMPSASQSLGALLVHHAEPDGTFKEAYRIWGVRDLPGCDGGTACQRAQLSRNGVAGGFDFNGDHKQDLAATRTNGLEIFGGRPLDDTTLGKLTMGCDPLFSLPALSTWTTSVPTALGDLDGDGCDEVGVRYTDNSQRFGVAVLFGFDATGTNCQGHTQASWVRLSGDAEKGVAAIQLGVSLAFAGPVVAQDTRAYVAIGANTFSYQGVSQPVVLLYDAAAIAARRPTSGERVVGALNDGLTPIPLVYLERAPGFGRMLWGGVDVTGDSVPDLVVSSLGANVNGDGVGAVFVFKGGTLHAGPNAPAMTIVSDERERASFGQDLSVLPRTSLTPAMLGIGAPLSYRSGTANGTVYLLPLDD